MIDSAKGVIGCAAYTIVMVLAIIGAIAFLKEYIA